MKSPKKAFAEIMIELLVLAIGPKQCDIEIKEKKTSRTIGRLQFTLHVMQLTNLEMSLNHLKCKLNGKEERPIVSQFKVLGGNDLPKVSEMTSTQIGKFKKEKN